MAKRSDLKILGNGDSVGLRLDIVKSGQPSSAECAFHKSFKHTSCICPNCKLYFSICMEIEWLWYKFIWTSIQKKTDFQKTMKNFFFQQLASPNIQICINRCFVSHIFGRSPYSIVFSFWLIGFDLFAWSLPEKLTDGKIHARDKTF